MSSVRGKPSAGSDMNFLCTRQVPKYCNSQLRLLTQQMQQSWSQICWSSTKIKTDQLSIPAIDENAKPTKSNDIDEALQIEAVLFENSSLINKPLIAQEAAQRHNPFQRNYPSAQQKLIRSKVIRQKPPKIIEDCDLDLQITRLNVKSPILSQIMTPVRSKRQRTRHNQIVIEGRRLIQDALQCGMRLHTLLFSDKEKLLQLRKELSSNGRANEVKIYEIAHHDLKVWSTLSTPPGVLAIFDKPTIEDQKEHKLYSPTPAVPITVVCDNIREPNNLGSIIRTCAAIPCHQLISMHGCCDAWESKALRAGCGGHFRLPIYDTVHWEELPMLIPADSADDCHVFIAENNVKGIHGRQSAINYSDIENTGAHNVLIIGGESHGVSKDAYSFMQMVGERGKCLHIPVARGADSLNVVSALTLMLYELRKRLTHL